MSLSRGHKGNVQMAARAAIANVSEYGRSFEGGAGRDIRMEGFVGAGAGQPGSPPTTPGAKSFKMPLLLLLAVVVLAS